MYKEKIPLLIVAVLFALIVVAMPIVAMIGKWRYGCIAWLAMGAIDFFLLKNLGIIKTKTAAKK